MAWHKYVRMRQISRYIQGAAAAKEACQAYDMPNLEFTFCASALAQLWLINSACAGVLHKQSSHVGCYLCIWQARDSLCSFFYYSFLRDDWWWGLSWNFVSRASHRQRTKTETERCRDGEETETDENREGEETETERERDHMRVFLSLCIWYIVGILQADGQFQKRPSYGFLSAFENGFGFRCHDFPLDYSTHFYFLEDIIRW